MFEPSSRVCLQTVVKHPQERLPSRTMTEMPSGRRIRLYREQLGITQEVLAGRAGVSKSWLSKVERGALTPGTVRSIVPLADALGVDPSDIIDRPRKRHVHAEDASIAIAPLRAILTDYGQFGRRLDRATEADLRRLRQDLDRCRALRRAGHFAETASLLAELLRTAETVARDATGDEMTRRTQWLLSQAYRTAAYTLFRSGERGELAWIAADRAASAARRADNLLLETYSARCLGHVFLHAGRVNEAFLVIMRALDALTDAESGSASQALHGALLLAGALAAARGNDRAMSQRLLRDAGVVAERVERDDGLFGPTNVAIHAVTVATELGDATEAIRLGENLDTSALPPSGLCRRAQVHLDVARGYEARRNDEAALHRILEAERIAPQLTRNSAVVATMVATMLHRRRHGSRTPGLHELAARVGVLT
jgi:transcriptional regulator with XRE-family HTH domain